MKGPETLAKAGYEKVVRAAEVAKGDHYDWIWIDTCCIDKTSSAELSEAINSMWSWYKRAGRCFAYLFDVDDEDQLASSEWFTRG